MLLEGKVAVVTGAGRGIGRAITLDLSKEGALLAPIDIEREGVESVCKELISQGKNAHPFVGDVSVEEDVQAMIAEIKTKFGKVDILINNAGISTKREGRKPYLTEISLDEWNKVIAVNLTSVFLCCKAVLPHMIKQRSGKIISISSSSVFDGGILPGVHYVASKGGISALTKNLGREVAPHGITVNAIAPGRTQTDMARLTSDDLNKALMERIPMGRFASPEDVSNAVLFFASEKSGYITGITLIVSGGYIMG